MGGSPKGSYLDDYLSRLTSRSLPASSTTLHLVHGLDDHVIAEYDASGTPVREYVWLDDRPVAAIAAGATPVTYFVHTDHLERPVVMTDASDAVVWRAVYLPYGEVHSITGSASLDYRFPGQWFQLESGLAYNRHRHYDPTTGRYVQPDPLGMPDGPSRWAYAGNSPLMNVDPEGQSALTQRFPWQQPSGCTGWEVGCGGGGGGGFTAGAGITLGGLLWSMCEWVLNNEQAEGDGGQGDPIGELRAKGNPQGKTGGGIKIYGMPGGAEGRQGDFDSIPGISEDKGEGVKVKTLSDGRKVISRPTDTNAGTSGGTIEVQSPTGKPWEKYRY